MAVMEGHLNSKKIKKILDQLEESGSYLVEAEFIEEYEKLNRDIDEAIRCGINTVRRRNMGYARSPTLTKAVTMVRYWKIQLRALRQNVELSKATYRSPSTTNHRLISRRRKSYLNSSISPLHIYTIFNEMQLRFEGCG